MTFNIITIFPDIFSSYFGESIIKRALEQKKIKINIINLRDFAQDKHKTVDDTPYGGGAGMVMKVDVLYRAICESCKIDKKNSQPKADPPRAEKLLLLSAKGKKWNQQLAQEYSQLEEITLICGRYEGVDERITDYIDEEISIGDYVLTGGEIGAMAIVDSVTRLLSGVLGNEQSAISESHSIPGELEYPQYTRPEAFVDNEGQEKKVPDILLSGNHKEIERWREENKRKTA